MVKKRTDPYAICRSPQAAQLRACLEQLADVRRQFADTADPALLEACIYTERALLCRYDYLLHQLRIGYKKGEKP